METGYPIQSEESIEVRTSDWLLCFFDLSAFTPMLSDFRFVLFRPIRIRAASDR